MHLDLTPHEAILLEAQLGNRIKELDRSLARTDQHDLQHQAAREIDELRAIERRLARTIESTRAEDGFV
jgi:hypothetical protein